MPKITSVEGGGLGVRGEGMWEEWLGWVGAHFVKQRILTEPSKRLFHVLFDFTKDGPYIIIERRMR